MKDEVIIASQPSDNSTDRVMEWLDYYGARLKRINNVDETSSSFKLELGDSLEEKKPRNIWFRRPDIIRSFSNVSKKHIKPIGDGSEVESLSRAIKAEIRHDSQSIKAGYWRSYKINKSVGGFLNNVPNKLRQLSLASDCGISIPHTLVTGNKQDLLAFSEQNKNGVIYKAVADSFMIQKKEHPYSMFTEELTKAELNELPTEFFRTLFQEKLDKDYEIRSFFLKDRFYSMAIFSQKDKQTAVDFRKYNTDVANRISPYKLPGEVEERTLKLMKLLNLDNGSIDFVKTKDGRWVYLEINPVGQFGMVSEPCNYNLEREIAKELI